MAARGTLWLDRPEMAPITDIVPYRERHHNGVVGLWQEVFADDPPWNEPRAAIVAKLRVQPELFFVAERDGAVVGTVLAGYDGHRGWIYALAVSPELRRRGIATALMTRAEQSLLDLGCVKLNLQVVAGNDAVAFYRSLGFQVEDRVSMGKPLGRYARRKVR